MVLKLINLNEFELIDLSVIIPCFNCENTLIRAINSILSQIKLLPSEIILVNDCSSDKTQATIDIIVKQYPELVKSIQLSKNIGAASSRNTGINMAKCKYIALLDADDTWHNNKLSVQYDYMMNNPNVILSGHLCTLYDENKVLNNMCESSNIRIITKYNVLLKTPFNTPTVMFKNLDFIRFPENRRYAEDAYLWQKLIYSQFMIVRLECLLAFVHKPLYGASGLSSNMWLMEKSELDNFLDFYVNGKINFLELCFALIVSLIKYGRRILLLKFINRNN
jgi:glycosyltransferase involved in cell wall biosynthesis